MNNAGLRNHKLVAWVNKTGAGHDNAPRESKFNPA